MTLPRFFLVAPETLTADEIHACATAASKAGECASIIVPQSLSPGDVARLQMLGIAVLIKDCEPRLVQQLKADGLHLSRNETIRDCRAVLKGESLGAFCATSRHLAMEAAEAGADYVAFAQFSQFSGEPLIHWWQDIFETPVVAFDAVTLENLAILLPQKPDFIRPSDEMWKDPNSARQIIAALNSRMAA